MPLRHGWNCHHLSQVWQCYDNLEMERFLPLNSKSHSIVHFIYDIVKRESSYDVLERIRRVISLMEYWTENDKQAIEQTAERAEDS